MSLAIHHGRLAVSLGDKWGKPSKRIYGLEEFYIIWSRYDIYMGLRAFSFHKDNCTGLILGPIGPMSSSLDSLEGNIARIIDETISELFDMLGLGEAGWSGGST